MKHLRLSRNHIYFWLTALLVITETLCYTYFRKYDSLRVANAVLYFVCGLGICVFSLLAAVKTENKNTSPLKPGRAATTLKYLCLAVFFVFICYLFIDFGNKTFAKHPIDYREADMLPLIKIACQRLLHGQDVYVPVKEIWGGELIPYLPAMWMPFLPAVIFNFDIRWVSLILSMACVGAILFYMWRINNRNFTFLIPVFFLIIFIWVKFYTWEDESYYRFTEEAIPAFFYFALCFALMYQNPWFTGAAIALCVLSRFSILSFLPFFFLWLLLNKDFKNFIKTSIACFGLLLILFIVPFFMHNPGFFMGIPGRYAANLVAVWRNYGYDLKNISTLGLAYVFGYSNLWVMSLLSYILQLSLPVAWLALFFFLNKKHTINKGLWVMAGLKLSLLIFYNFIAMPYIYLFAVPGIISYPLLLAVAEETGC